MTTYRELKAGKDEEGEDGEEEDVEILMRIGPRLSQLVEAAWARDLKEVLF